MAIYVWMTMENPLPNNTNYRQVVGALLIATATRPDILKAVNILSGKNEKQLQTG